MLDTAKVELVTLSNVGERDEVPLIAAEATEQMNPYATAVSTLRRRPR